MLNNTKMSYTGLLLFVCDWLFPTLQINDRETTRTKSDLVIEVVTPVIGTTMLHDAYHPE